jgi:hypothetical protein
VGVLPSATAYAIAPEDVVRYDGLFASYDKDGDGYIQGAEAVAIFSQSGLDVNVLRTIWALADDDKDSRLTREEFAVAFHLILCIGKKGLPLPPGLPAPLRSFIANKGIVSSTPVNVQYAQSKQSEISQKQSTPQVLNHSKEGQAAATITVTPIPTTQGVPGVQPLSHSNPVIDPRDVTDMTGAVSSIGDAAKKLTQSHNVSIEASENVLSAIKALIQKLNTERIALTAAAANAESDASSIASKLTHAMEDLAGMIIFIWYFFPYSTFRLIQVYYSRATRSVGRPPGTQG